MLPSEECTLNASCCNTSHSHMDLFKFVDDDDEDDDDGTQQYCRAHVVTMHHSSPFHLHLESRKIRFSILVCLHSFRS